MTTSLEFGVDQLPIYSDFKAAAIGWNKRQTLNLWFEIFEKVICQANGPAGIVSDRAVNNLDFQHSVHSSYLLAKIILLLI